MARMKKFTTKSDAVAPVPVEAWKPAPDMGKIQPPPRAEKVCANTNCTHKGATHYGGPSGWCNVGGCNCQRFE